MSEKESQSHDSVLAIEPNARMRHLIRVNLEANGMRVCELGSSVQYLPSLQDQPYRLLLLSMEPDESDTDFLVQTIRERVGWRMPVLFVTDASPSRMLLDKLSPAAYLRKPFNVSNLVQHVQKMLTENTSRC